jgi:hypothetical protein
MHAIVNQHKWHLATPPAYFWLALRHVRNYAAVRCENDYLKCRDLTDEASYKYSMNVVNDYLESFEEHNWNAVVKVRKEVEWDLPHHGDSDSPCVLCPWPKNTDPRILPTTYPLLPKRFWEAVHKVQSHYRRDLVCDRINDPNDISSSLVVLNRWSVAARNKGWRD